MTFCARKLCDECYKYHHEGVFDGERWLCFGCYYRLAFIAAAQQETKNAPLQ